MKSRIVRPVNRRGQTNRKKKKSRVSGETQPMRPVGQNIRENRLSETQPMRPVSIRTADSRPGYSTYRNAYRQTIERRRQVLRTPQPQEGNRDVRSAAKVKRTGVSSLMARRKSKAGTQETYFDFDLLLVIICVSDS